MPTLDLIANMIYINVEYPQHTLIFLRSLGISIWNYIPSPVSLIFKPLSDEVLSNEEEMEYFRPPHRYEEEGVTSFFVENAGGVVTVDIALWIAFVISIGLKQVKALQGNTCLRKIKVMLKWNMLGRMFLEQSSTLMIASLLQFRKISFIGRYQIICGVVTLLATIYFAALLSHFLRFLRRKSSSQLQLGYIRNLFGTIYEGINLKVESGKYYYFVCLFRAAVLSIMTVFVEAKPLLQIISLIVYNMFFIYFVFRAVKFKAPWLNIQNRIIEILIICGEVGVLLLTVPNAQETYYDVVGWLIIVLFGGAVGMEFTYVLVLEIKGYKVVILRLINYLRGKKKTKSEKMDVSETDSSIMEFSRPSLAGKKLKVRNTLDISKLDLTNFQENTGNHQL